MPLWFSALARTVGLTLALVLVVPLGWLPTSRPALAQSSGGPAERQAGMDEPAIGVIVDTTNPRSMQLAREAGFTHAKMIIHWPRLEPKRGRYTFQETSENDLDNVMKAARGEGMKLVVRVDGVPDWAGGSPAKLKLDGVEAFYAAMAAHAKGTVVAYEILNEPNLPFEWGGSPNPGGYAGLLKAAYRGVKKGDPGALVIGGGLSPATGGAGGTLEDVDFLRGMYAAGVKGSMDALSIHNYGGNHEPERDPGDCGICFRRAEVYRQIMVEQGDATTPIWATEFGWLLDPGRDMGQYDWMRVSAEKQADYIVRSYQYAQKNWPWIGGLLLSNLDASTSPYHTGPQNGMPWFAILNKDHSPRPAWRAFKAWREQVRTEAASRPRPSASPPAVPTPTPPAVATGPSAVTDQSPPPPGSASPATESADSGAPAVGAPDPAGGTVGQAGPSAPTGQSTPTEPAPSSAPATTPTPVPASPSTDSSPTPTPTPTATPAPPATGATTTRLRVVKTDGAGVNLRARPRADAALLVVLPEGTTVEVVGEDVRADGRTWRNVRTARGQTGWVAGQYLAP